MAYQLPPWAVEGQYVRAGPGRYYGQIARVTHATPVPERGDHPDFVGISVYFEQTKTSVNLWYSKATGKPVHGEDPSTWVGLEPNMIRSLPDVPSFWSRLGDA